MNQERDPYSAALPHSEACERNKGPILAQLEAAFAASTTVLEIGSGTGQHAVYFAGALEHLRWIPADTGEYLPGLRARMAAQNHDMANVRRWTSKRANITIIVVAAVDRLCVVAESVEYASDICRYLSLFSGRLGGKSGGLSKACMHACARLTPRCAFCYLR